MISVYLAWRNSRTDKDKAKLDVMEVEASGRVRLEDCDAFLLAMHNMRYLFDKKSSKRLRNP